MAVFGPLGRRLKVVAVVGLLALGMGVTAALGTLGAHDTARGTEALGGPTAPSGPCRAAVPTRPGEGGGYDDGSTMISEFPSGSRSQNIGGTGSP